MTHADEKRNVGLAAWRKAEIAMKDVQAGGESLSGDDGKRGGCCE